MFMLHDVIVWFQINIYRFKVSHSHTLRCKTALDYLLSFTSFIKFTLNDALKGLPFILSLHRVL